MALKIDVAEGTEKVIGLIIVIGAFFLALVTLNVLPISLELLVLGFFYFMLAGFLIFESFNKGLDHPLRDSLSIGLGIVYIIVGAGTVWAITIPVISAAIETLTPMLFIAGGFMALIHLLMK